MPLRIAGPDMIANHDHSGSDTDADLKGRRPLKMANSFNQSQTRADRPLDIIFMRFRITKINKNPVTHVVGDEAVPATP